jgi:hypothetical protein
MAVEIRKSYGLVNTLAEEYGIVAEVTEEDAVRVFGHGPAMVDCLIAANTMYRWTIAVEDTSGETFIMRRRDAVTMALRAIEREAQN